MENKSEEKIDLLTILDDMWKGFKRYGIFLLLLAIVCSGALYIRARRSYVPMYASSATFTVSSASDGLYVSSSYYNRVTAAQMAKTFPYILTSGLLYKTVAEDLGLDSVPGTITAEVMSGTNLFTIKVVSADAEMSYTILDSVIRNYPSVAEYVIGRTQMEMLDITDIPETASNLPNFKRSALKGLLLGLGLDLMLLLLYAVSRKTIRSEEDLKKALNVECICAIPQIAFKKRSRKYRRDVSIYNSKISQSFIEAVRVLRARIEKEMARQNYKTLLVTSAAPGEGKSTIAANAAMALAMSGRRVALVDCDLRSPSVRSVLNMPDKNGPGVVDYLKDEAQFQDVFIYNEKYKMYVVPGGEPCDNASEIIDTPRMEQLIARLKEEVEYVILDTAPVGMLTDTAVLANVVETALFVVKQDYMVQDVIIEGISQLAESGIMLAGCILNGVQESITGSGYRGYRYYGRYGYGMSQEKPKTEPEEQKEAQKSNQKRQQKPD